ncbi:MAG: WD40 repeat domain-containing protein [Pseudomonadota bacterium]
MRHLPIDRLPFPNTTSLAYSPDETKLVIIGGDGAANTIGTKTGQLSAPLNHGFQGAATLAAYSADGKEIILVEFFGEVEVFDAQTGNFVRRMQEHDGRPVALSENGKYYATISGDNIVKIYDIENGEELEEIRLPLDFSGPLAIDEGGNGIITFSFDGGLRMHFPDKVLDLIDLDLGPTNMSVASQSISMSRGGDLLSLSAADYSTRLIDLRVGSEIFSLGGWSIFSRISPAGRLITIDPNRLPQGNGLPQENNYWEGSAYRNFDYQSGDLVSMLLPSERDFVVFHGHGDVTILDSRTGVVSDGSGFNEYVLGVALSYGGDTLAVNDRHNLYIGDIFGQVDNNDVYSFPKGISSVSFSLDSKKVLVSTWGGQLHTLGSSQPVDIGEGITAAAISYDGEWVITSDVAGRICRVNLAGDDEIICEDFDGDFRSIAMSVDGRRAIVWGDEGPAYLIDSEDLAEIARQEYGIWEVVSAGFFEDQARFAVGNGEGLLRVLDLETGKTILSLQEAAPIT